MSKQRKRRGGSSETMCDKFNYWLIQKLPSKRTRASASTYGSSATNSKADSVASSVQPTAYTTESVVGPLKCVENAVTAFEDEPTINTATAVTTAMEVKDVTSIGKEGPVVNAVTSKPNDGHRYSASGRRVITLRGESIEELTEVNGYTPSDLRLPPELENETDAMEGLRRFGRAASMTLRQFSSISRRASVLPEGEEEREDIIDEDKVDCKDGVCKPMEMA